MSLIRISESDDWVVDYDRERGMYRVGYFQDGHFVAEHWFDCFEERELTSIERHIYDYASAYVKGAAEFMKYVEKYYEQDVEIVIPPPLKFLLIRFCEQFGTLREIDD